MSRFLQPELVKVTRNKLILGMLLFMIILACAGCAPFVGERTSKIELNILGSTWKSETTMKGAYTEPKEVVP